MSELFEHCNWSVCVLIVASNCFKVKTDVSALFFSLNYAQNTKFGFSKTNLMLLLDLNWPSIKLEVKNIICVCAVGFLRCFNLYESSEYVIYYNLKIFIYRRKCKYCKIKTTYTSNKLA